MGMKITQEFMDNEVIKPIMKELDELRFLIKRNDKSQTHKIDNMFEIIAKLPKKKR
jgi:hypothetical protein